MKKNYKLETIAIVVLSTCDLPDWSAMLRRSKNVVDEWRAMKEM